MKKSVKILILVLSLALLVSAAVTFSASAESTAPEVISKNIKVDGNFCLMFAVDPATVAGDNVTLKVYNKETMTDADIVYNKTMAKTETTDIDLDHDGEEEFAAVVFETNGVSAKDIADTWWFTAESNGVVSEADTYSVKEYAFERLYGDNIIAATDDYGLRQKAFYLDILEIGSSAQDLLVNTKLEANGEEPERLAKEYAYAGIQNGTFGGLKKKFVEIGEQLTLAEDEGFTDPSWKVLTYGTNGVLLKEETVDLGSTITVAGNTVIIPGWTVGKTPGKYYSDIGTAALGFDGLTTFPGDTGLYTNTSAEPETWTSGRYWSYEAVSGRCNVLCIEKSVTKARIWAPVIDKADGNGNTLVVEFDAKFDGTFNFNSGENANGYYLSNLLVLQIDSAEASANTINTSKQVCLANIYMTDGDPEAFVNDSGTTQYKGGAAINVRKNNTAETELALNEWHNICYEFTESEDGSQCDYVVYVDGQRVYSSYSTLSGKLSDAKSLNLSVMDRFVGAVMLDNVFVGFVEKN